MTTEPYNCQIGSPSAADSRQKPHVAFVVQRCGVEVNGGAEQHCLQVAQHMAKHWDTEILTTCALDYMEWYNAYPAGAEHCHGTIIRRFPVDRPRNVDQFNELSAELHRRQQSTTIAEQEQWMRCQGPVSSPLLNYLQENQNTYDAFIFFGYLYATTYFGLPIVANKAFLAPLAHDEWPIYFSMWDSLFRMPRALIFNSEPEREFLRRRFSQLNLTGPVVGVGIDPPQSSSGETFRQQYGINAPFLLYVGRVDESKGCADLLAYHQIARREFGVGHKLVFAGTEVMPIPFDDDVISLGFIPDVQKWSALAACDWFVMPSPNESLCMALLEAWQVKRPALVNGRCEVLREACACSNGGLWYETAEQFAVAIGALNETSRSALGLAGHHYVNARYGWQRVEREYDALLA